MTGDVVVCCLIVDEIADYCSWLASPIGRSSCSVPTSTKTHYPSLSPPEPLDLTCGFRRIDPSNQVDTNKYMCLNVLEFLEVLFESLKYK